MLRQCSLKIWRSSNRYFPRNGPDKVPTHPMGRRMDGWTEGCNGDNNIPPSIGRGVTNTSIITFQIPQFTMLALTILLHVYYYILYYYIRVKLSWRPVIISRACHSHPLAGPWWVHCVPWAVCTAGGQSLVSQCALGGPPQHPVHSALLQGY